MVLNYVWNLPFGHPKSALRHVSGLGPVGGDYRPERLVYDITDTGGNIFFVRQGALSTANMCPGKTYGDLLSSAAFRAEC